MASRRDFYLQQLVQEDELDASNDGLEAADLALVNDFDLHGVCNGLAVSQHAGTPDLTVDVTSGVAYDQTGQRCAIASTQSPSLATDSSSVSTSVTTPGNEKWVSLSIKFARALSDPRLDGNLNSVYFVRAESFTFHVAQGAEAAIGVATRPALITDGILLCDVLLVNAQTQIVNANISTTRRQLAGAAAGFILVAPIPYAGGPAWADGTTNPATTAEAQLDKIITDLINAAGSARINGAAYTGARFDLSAASIQAQLRAIADAVSFKGAYHHTGQISPTDPGSDQNNWAPTGIATTSFVRVVSLAASIKITGIAAPSDGRLLTIWNNDSTNSLMLVHESASSTDVNRFKLPEAKNLVIPPLGFLMLRYDGLSGSSSRWYVAAMPTGVTTERGQVQVALSSNQDNYTTTRLEFASTLAINATATFDLTGVAVGQYDGRILTIINRGLFTITLKHNVTSTAANRFFCPNQVDFALLQNAALRLHYFAADSRWYVLGGN